jgi:hypothetical protein
MFWGFPACAEQHIAGSLAYDSIKGGENPQLWLLRHHAVGSDLKSRTE